MKKRIGSKLYDTDTAEHISDTDDGQLYRKRTRDREYFKVTDDGKILPLEDYEQKPAPREYRVRIDKDTYRKISEIAKVKKISLSEVVRQAMSKIV